MKCYTAIGGVIIEGIRLVKDHPTSAEGKPRYFVHVKPDHYGEVQSVQALISTGCAHLDGDDVVVDRCLYVGGDLQPETKPDDKVLVLGGIDQRQAVFTGDLSQPAHYRTALGPNICFHSLVSRHLNREMGRTTGHEQYMFLGIFAEGDRMEANVIFEDEAGAGLDLWADGVLMSYRGGELRCHEVPVVRKADRFRARR
ncbi:MAG: hypothetical protein K8F91_19350 [Candidatus Obscuribacterales bacterium]|nr:hypothetical protein [Candidatus Obscuribacterales bacterium]